MLTLRKNRKRSFKDTYLINQLKTSTKLLEHPIKNEETVEEKLSDKVDLSHEVITPISDQRLDLLKIKEPQFRIFKESGDTKLITDLARGDKISENSVDLNLVPPEPEHNHIDKNIVINKNVSAIYPNYKQDLLTKINKNDINQVYKQKLIDGHSPKIKKNKKIKKSIADFY